MSVIKQCYKYIQNSFNDDIVPFLIVQVAKWYNIIDKVHKIKFLFYGS